MLGPYFFIWDEDDNVPHLAEHDVTPEEAAYVVEHAEADDQDVSRRSGRPIVFGDTPTGRHLMVAYRVIDPSEGLIYIVTAYDVPRQISRNRR